MIETLCLILLGAAIFFMCIFLISNETVSKKFGQRSLLFLAVIFVVFSLVFKPESFIRWDLIEHFKLVDEMRYGGWDYAIKESQYSDLFVYNFFAYLISLLPTNFKNLLTVIPLIIDFAIVGYICKKMFNTHLPDTSGKARVLAIMMWLFTFSVKLAISGIRCSLAVSIAVLAVYLEMIQKKKRIFSIFLYIASIFIHNFAIVIILVRLLTMLKKPILIMLLSLTISFTLEPFARFVVSHVDNEYISFSFIRILETVDEMGFANIIQQLDLVSLVIYVCFIVFGIYLFIISAKAKKTYKENGYCKNVANFCATVGAVAIGLSFNYLYLQRFMYLISFALLMMIPLHNRGRENVRNENIIILPMSLFLFFFNDIYIFMVNYVGSYFLSF